MHQDIHQQFRQNWKPTIERLLAPTGATYLDGARLAVLNTATLVAALIVAGIVSILWRIADWVLPLPVAPAGLLIILFAGLFGVLVWHRYGNAHRRVASRRMSVPNPERFGLVGSAPYAFMAIILGSSGLLRLVLAAVSFDAGGALNAFERLLYAAGFVILVALSALVAANGAGRRLRR